MIRCCTSFIRRRRDGWVSPSPDLIRIAGKDSQGVRKVDEKADFFLGGVVAERVHGLGKSHCKASLFMKALPVVGYVRQSHVPQALRCEYSHS